MFKNKVAIKNPTKEKKIKFNPRIIEKKLNGK